MPNQHYNIKKMFFIIPIGSEKGVRRLPYITIGLIVINVIIWIITGSINSRQIGEMEKVSKELWAIQEKYIYRLVEKDPEALAKFDFNRLIEKFKTDSIIPPDHKDYEAWNNLYEQYHYLKSNHIFEKLGFNPATFDFFSIFTAMFVHANFFHLFFNMLFLWMVGCNIEDDWGYKIFPGLYLIGGAVATLIHAVAFPKSTVPLIGASGAIAAIMGAFMVRHFKTKVRFAYFLWFFYRPYIGTFSVWAGVALPIWLLEQLLGASWSIETGTAYWAHIGGFVFGGIVGASMALFGWEKKYIAPMVEETFEKLKLSYTMKEANRKMELGDTVGAIPLLLQAVSQEPRNIDAPLSLARIYAEKGETDKALTMYNKALNIALIVEETNFIVSIYDEVCEKDMLNRLTETNVYRLADYFEKVENFNESVKIFNLYTSLFHGGKMRPKAFYRVHLLYKNKLNNPEQAQATLNLLKQEYPDWLQT